MVVWDDGHLPSNEITLHISIMSINDEPPQLISALIHHHREGDGPAAILDADAALYDTDNCPEHRLIAEIQLVLGGFVAGEDTLLDGAGQEIGHDDANGIFEFGSGSRDGSGLGEWMIGTFQYIRLTCDQAAYPECYNSLLRGLQYGNNASEPTPTHRTITLEVSLHCPISYIAIAVTVYMCYICRLRMKEGTI